jgi:hypothetical protein
VADAGPGNSADGSDTSDGGGACVSPAGGPCADPELGRRMDPTSSIAGKQSKLWQVLRRLKGSQAACCANELCDRHADLAGRVLL